MMVIVSLVRYPSSKKRSQQREKQSTVNLRLQSTPFSAFNNSAMYLGSSSTQLSTYDIQKDLEAKQKEYWEQLILPRAVELEDFGLFLDPTTKNFVSNILQQFKESREMQSNLEENIRQKLRRYGDEKLIIANTPGDEVVKGFPEVELKWMFGEKEIVVPKAVRLHLYHGWKKWREEAKADLKRRLLENVESGRQYVAQRQVQYA
ncbi:hypothetical protein ACLOJK_017678 [Asimina triloba]